MVGKDSVPYPGNLRHPLHPWFGIAGQECHAWKSCFEHGAVAGKRAWAIAGDVAIVVAAEHIAACCAAAITATVVADLAATYAEERNHVRPGFDLRSEAFHLGECLMASFLRSC